MEVFVSRRGRSGTGPLPSAEHDNLNLARPTRVLVVEDEWLVSMEIEAVLLDAGYEVVGTAVTADEAVEMAARLSPDMATMDIRLRGQRDGIDAAIELYQRFGLRCLFISAYSNGNTRKRVGAARPLGSLQKPFTPAQLVLALDGALRVLREGPVR